MEASQIDRLRFFASRTRELLHVRVQSRCFGKGSGKRETRDEHLDEDCTARSHTKDLDMLRLIRFAKHESNREDRQDTPESCFCGFIARLCQSPPKSVDNTPKLRFGFALEREARRSRGQCTFFPVLVFFLIRMCACVKTCRA